MAEYRNIICVVNPTDGPDACLEHALDLARRSGGSLTLVETFEPLTWLQRLAHPLADEIREDRQAVARHSLEELTLTLGGRGVDLSCRLLYGRPEVEISQEVIRGDHDLVILAGRGPGAERAFPPLAIRLMRICPCAVLVVQPHHPPPFRRVLAAIDPDPGSVVKSELARRTISSALHLAHDEQAECLVTHAWAPLDEDSLSHDLDGVSHETFENRLREAAEEAFERAVDPFRPELPDDAMLLRRGTPIDVISGLIESRDVDLVVMGTVARGGLQGYLVGNTAELVLRRTYCSVLSLKPQGFRSPVGTPGSDPG